MRRVMPCPWDCLTSLVAPGRPCVALAQMTGTQCARPLGASVLPMIRLSVLDQSVSVAGRGEDEAIRDTLGLAEHCEALGYHRFWLSEHHGLPTIVGSAPEILMAAVAA